MHHALRKFETYFGHSYTGLLVQSVSPWEVVILRAGKCVDSVSLTPEEGAYLTKALGDGSAMQPLAFFIVALHQGYWPAPNIAATTPARAAGAVNP